MAKEQDLQGGVVQMPRYQSHKEVWALKIREVGPPNNDGGVTLHFEDAGYAALAVGKEYVEKHKPQAGGYYVAYKDGYKSFSPAAAFEGGYKRVS